jgi:hypothetical protein
MDGLNLIIPGKNVQPMNWPWWKVLRKCCFYINILDNYFKSVALLDLRSTTLWAVLHGTHTHIYVYGPTYYWYCNIIAVLLRLLSSISVLLPLVLRYTYECSNTVFSLALFRCSLLARICVLYIFAAPLWQRQCGQCSLEKAQMKAGDVPLRHRTIIIKLIEAAP